MPVDVDIVKLQVCIVLYVFSLQRRLQSEAIHLHIMPQGCIWQSISLQISNAFDRMHPDSEKLGRNGICCKLGEHGSWDDHT